MKDRFPYKVPKHLPADAEEVLSYWKKLRRGQSQIPFSDDIRFSALPGREDDLIFIDAFAKPNRYRFGLVGGNVVKACNKEVSGNFLDECELVPPLTLIHSQASAAAEMRQPSFYEGDNYVRLLLPAWGDGHVSALLGFILRQTT